MGAFLAKIWRRKQSTRDVLEKIRDDIRDIEEFKQNTQAWHKKLIGYLLAYFSVLYLIAALVAYFKYFNNPAWRDLVSQLQLLTPFIVAPLIFIFLKRFLTWWYHRKIRRNEIELEKLKKQKAKILDEVMENETYKVAKEILDEFASDQEKRALNLIKSPLPATSSSRLNKTSIETPRAPHINQSGMELRKREVTNDRSQSPRLNTTQAVDSPMRPQSRIVQSNLNASRLPHNSSMPGGPGSSSLQQRPAPGPPLPRPVMPRDRGYMDRIVEYLVGDGPNNRFALICRQCQSHNGMALKEEFEYIAYRCCYCHYWNPARKQRPTAPKLEASSMLKASTESSSDDDDDAGLESQAAGEVDEKKDEQSSSQKIGPSDEEKRKDGSQISATSHSQPDNDSNEEVPTAAD